MRRRNRRVLALTASCGLFVSLLVGPAVAGPDNKIDVIVVLRDGSAPQDVARDHAVDIAFVYSQALNGFAGRIAQGRMAGLEHDRRVDYVELDSAVSVAAQTVPTGLVRSYASTNASIDIDGVDDLRVDVDVAVIDTGIDLEHPDLNVVNSVSCFYTSGGGPVWSRPTTCGAGGDDDHYHGTHVAGSIGALDNGIGVVGVAPGARLWAVKVLNSSGSGYASNVIAGIDYVAAHANEIEVANMSLGGGFSQAENDAVKATVAKGVVFVVAAGNSDADARNSSPASEPSAVTVSALADFDGVPGGFGAPTCRSDQDDTLADFSNWGPAIDIAAPGVCILSTYPIEKGSYGTISGTSMASPHVAGAAALLASSHDYGSTRDAADATSIRDTLVASGNLDWTDDSGDGIKERLLDVSSFTPTQVVTAVGNAPPIASFTAACTELACNFDGTGSSDSDGTVVSWDWTFGDGGTSSGATPSHTFGADGTYTVALTVTDDGGQSSTASRSVAVAGASTGGFTVMANGYKVKGRQQVDLSWSGSTAENVDVWRDGAKIATTANNGAYTDAIGNRGGGSYTYKVCAASTVTCSNTVTVAF